MAMEPKEGMQTLTLDSTNNPSLEPEKNTEEGSEEKLQTQKSLEEEMKCLLCERDALLRDLNSKSDEAEALFNEVVELERINDMCLLDLKELNLKHRALAQEKMADKRRFDSNMADSEMIVTSILETNSDLEERLGRNTRRTQMFLDRVFAVLKSSIDLMGVCVDGEDEMEKEEEDVKEEDWEVVGEEVQEMEEEIIMIQRYESKLKAMEKALKRRAFAGVHPSG